MTVLLREAIGDRLRHARTNQHRTLREVSRAARVSLGYLSEVERGRKEASSELLAAICDALALPLSELLHLVAVDVRSVADVRSVDDVRSIEEVRAIDDVPVDAAVPAVPADASELVPSRSGAEPTLQGGRMQSALLGNDLSDLRLQPALTHRLSTAITPRSGGVIVAA